MTKTFQRTGKSYQSTTPQDFQIKIAEEIQTRIFSDNPQAKRVNNHIRGITCPSCGKDEAWTYHGNPLAIICPRKNHCSIITPTKTLFPECFENFSKRFPATKADPNATATAYLISRSLNPAQISYTQGSVKVDNTTYQTVKIEVSREITYHRLIDYKGKDKVRIYGGYSGKVWKPDDFNYSRETWITESILDAQSLIQSGRQAIAILSAGTIPKKFYEQSGILKSKSEIILALDNDEAGRDGIDKHREYFKEKSFENYKTAIPYFKDWNDDLCNGLLAEDKKEKSFEDSFWRGRLFMAESINDFHTVYSERYTPKGLNFFIGLLEYAGGYWHIGVKEKENKKEPTFKQLSDFTLQTLFAEEDDTIEYDAEIKHIVQVKKLDWKKGRKVRLSASELTQSTEFRKRLKKSADVLWRGGTLSEMNQITLHLERQNAPVVRVIDKIGYDERSGCYVFGKFLYDGKGKRHEVNDNQYFDTEKLSCKFTEAVITGFEEGVSVSNFLSLLERVYKQRAWIVFGFFVASLFKRTVVDGVNENAFPYLSVFGKQSSGKTTLIDILMRVTFQTYKGIGSGDKQSSPKSISRQLAARQSLAIPYNESNGKMFGINENRLLDGYHEGSLYDRAAYTNDNQVLTLPLKATICFVQNDEPFSRGAVKQRTMSIEFFNTPEYVNADSKEAMTELKNIPINN